MPVGHLIKVQSPYASAKSCPCPNGLNAFVDNLASSIDHDCMEIDLVNLNWFTQLECNHNVLADVVLTLNAKTTPTEA